MQGVCPDIGLYDFRVLGSSLGDSEFAVSAALQFIRYYNEQAGFQRIHGVNMSLAIRHNVRNYACGQTPVCIEAEALVANGVVVVAAAGNRGFQQYQLADNSTFEGYAVLQHHRPRQCRRRDHGRRDASQLAAHLWRQLLFQPRPDRRRPIEAGPARTG